MQKNTPPLKIDWASKDAALYACKKWHYSKCLPAGRLIKLGVWEDGVFIGVVIFSRGAAPNIGKPYNLKQTQICELTRVALGTHVVPVSKIVKVALAMLKKNSPGLQLVVSYADSKQAHVGGIYQAGNWIYVGPTYANFVRVAGKLYHGKSCFSKFGTCSAKKIPGARAELQPAKHKYLMPLNKRMRQRVEPLRQPYPKRSKQASDEHPSSSGGAAPTRALQA